ncbi:uncharacterized protein V3H82_005868 isoform 1-T1 [Fundulus diaphanus]
MVSLNSRALTLESELFRDSSSSSLLSFSEEDGVPLRSCDSPGARQQGALQSSSPEEGEEEEEENKGVSLQSFQGATDDPGEDCQEPKLPEFSFHPSSPFSPTLEDIEEFLKEEMEQVEEDVMSTKEETSPLPCSFINSPVSSVPSASSVEIKSEPGVRASLCPSSPETSEKEKCAPIKADLPPSSQSNPSPATVTPPMLLRAPVVLQLQPLPLAQPQAPTGSPPSAQSGIWLTHLVMGLQGATAPNLTLVAPQVSSTATTTSALLPLNGDNKSDQKYVKIAPLPITTRTLEITAVGGSQGTAVLKAAAAPRVLSIGRAVSPPPLSLGHQTVRVHSVREEVCPQRPFIQTHKGPPQLQARQGGQGHRVTASAGVNQARGSGFPQDFLVLLQAELSEESGELAVLFSPHPFDFLPFISSPLFSF